MPLKGYCVTVMDTWTPTRTFWTFGGALRFATAHNTAAHLFVWDREWKVWREVDRIWLVRPTSDGRGGRDAP
jgi:hypothetical protein